MITSNSKSLGFLSEIVEKEWYKFEAYTKIS
jgi:hypothetical protein